MSVQLYSFENRILAITQQFLVLHKGIEQQTNAAYQKSLLVVTARLILMSYHFITDGYHHTTTTIYYLKL